MKLSQCDVASTTKPAQNRRSGGGSVAKPDVIQFTSRFVRLLGMLFTRTGLEVFAERSREAMRVIPDEVDLNADAETFNKVSLTCVVCAIYILHSCCTGTSAGPPGLSGQRILVTEDDATACAWDLIMDTVGTLLRLPQVTFI